MPKNILVILTDQLRKDTLGCYGNPVCRTPNLDRLAERGMRFNRNYVANPICMPNRLSIFTGRNIRSHDLWTNGLLVQECPTLPGHFAEHGYSTASIGKIHFTPFGAAGDHMESGDRWANRTGPIEWHGPYWGFQHVELTIGHTAPVAHYGEWFFKNGGTHEMRKRRPVSDDSKSYALDMPPELHDSAFVADRATDFINRCAQSETPFFLVASFPDPHAPFNPPASVAAEYSQDEVAMPLGGPEDLRTRPPHYEEHFRGAWHRSGPRSPMHPEGLTESETRERIALTYAMVDLVDRNVGKILGSLAANGLEEDTVVVFTSDHGELLGDHGLWAKGPFFYEGLVNTPLLVSNPGAIEPGVSETLFSDIDIAPTLCDLAGVPVMPYMNGLSQAPHIFDRNAEVRDCCLVEYRNGYGDADRSSKLLVTRDSKYVRYQGGEEELTDLRADPCEFANVAGRPEYGDEKDRLKTMMLDEILATERKGPAQLSHG